MRIGIDARTIFRPELRGIGKSLVDLLGSMGSPANGHEFVLYYEARPDTVSHAPKIPHATTRSLRADHQTLFEQWVLPRAVAADRCDIFHSPANTTMWYQSCPVVVTLHDLMGYHQARQRGPLGRRIDWTIIQPRAYQRVKTIITVSTYSKQQLIGHLGVPEEKVRVVPPGIHPRYRKVPDPDVQRVVTQFGISRPYVFVAGGETPRKNLPRILEAMHSLWASHTLTSHVVVSGIRPEVCDRLVTNLPWVRGHPKVHFLPYVTEDELVALYSGAQVSVYASLDEGFGLPPLEAMACEVPVIASNAASIPEAVGDAAYLVDAKQVDEIARAILTLSQSLALREMYVQRGAQRARQLTWERAAQETLRIYEAVAHH